MLRDDRQTRTYKLHVSSSPNKNGCNSQNRWRFLACARLAPLVGGIRTACSETLHPQSTAPPVRPARIPPRSTHQLAQSFDFDSLALCLHSGRGHAHVHPWAFMVVRGRPGSRTFKRNSPIILYLLTGGGVRVVARNGEPRPPIARHTVGGVACSSASTSPDACVCGGGRG